MTRWLVRVAFALAVVAVAADLWLLQSRLAVPSVPEEPPQPRRSGARESSGSSASQDVLAHLLRGDPFRLGAAGAAPEVDTVETGGDARDMTEVDGLTLVGTALGAGGEGVALFAKKGVRHLELAHPLDTVADRWVLRAVEPDAVLLEQPGRRVRLVLSRPQSRGRTPGAAVPLHTTVVDRTKVDGIEKISDTHYRVDRSLIRERLQDLAALNREIGVAPVSSGGFRIVRMRSSSVFRHIGLRRGDVLLRVNGRDVSNPAELVGLMQSVDRIRFVELQLLRSGDPLTLSFEIQ